MGRSHEEVSYTWRVESWLGNQDLFVLCLLAIWQLTKKAMSFFLEKTLLMLKKHLRCEELWLVMLGNELFLSLKALATQTVSLLSDHKSV